MGHLARHDGHTLEIYQENDHFILHCKTCDCTVTSEDNIDNDRVKTLRERALAEYGRGDDVEIDEDAVVSSVEDGYWVQAWLWLYGDAIVDEKDEKDESQATKPYPLDDMADIEYIEKMKIGESSTETEIKDMIQTLARVLKRHLARSSGGK